MLDDLLRDVATGSLDVMLCSMYAVLDGLELGDEIDGS